MTGISKIITELPDAKQSPRRFPELKADADDLSCTQPYVFNPAFPSCQLELNVCPQGNVGINDLPFEANLNTFKIGRHASTGDVVFPYDTFHAVGAHEPGFQLVLDNSPTPHKHLGPHVRLCWTIDFADIPSHIAAVAFSLSVRYVQQLRMLVLNAYSAHPDASTTRHKRSSQLGEARFAGQQLQERSQGHEGGTFVVAILARSGAWWHMHVPATFSHANTGVSFAQHVCQSSHGGQAPIWPILQGVHKASQIGYAQLRTISLGVATARGLPVASTLERLTCGLYSTHTQPLLELENPHFEDMRQERRVGLVKRATRRGTAEWADSDRVIGRLCIYRVASSDPRIVRVAMPCGGAAALARSIGSNSAAPPTAALAVDQDDGVGMRGVKQPQVAEVRLAQLWALLPPGEASRECLVEVRLRKPPGDESGGQPATVHMHVEVSQDQGRH